ncbi:LOW QUALITY PROTEIN: hypothetical protein ACHAW6_001277 [Cyclotella cf. meneghiniana]
MNPSTSRHTQTVPMPLARHTGKPNVMVKSPSTQTSRNGRCQKSKNGWSVPPLLVHSSQPYRTDSLAPNSPRMSDWTTSPSDTADAPQISLTNATAAEPATQWRMDSAAREADLLAFAMMTCATNGPTSAASLTDSQVMINLPSFMVTNSGVTNATPTTLCTANPTNTIGDKACRDVLAHSFWNHGQGTVFDVRICDMDSCSYGNTSLSKILEHHAKEKRGKYEAACLNQRRDFTPLDYSVDSMASKDA